MRISEQVLEDFGGYLAGEEKSGATVEKYVREARRFMGWLAGREAGGETAGFALVNRFSALGEAPDHAMAEFFLLPGWRGKGLGLAFAQEIFRQRPGSWEIKYHRENRPAGALWSRAAEPFRPRVTPLGEEVVLSFVVPKEALL